MSQRKNGHQSLKNDLVQGRTRFEHVTCNPVTSTWRLSSADGWALRQEEGDRHSPHLHLLPPELCSPPRSARSAIYPSFLLLPSRILTITSHRLSLIEILLIHTRSVFFLAAHYLWRLAPVPFIFFFFFFFFIWPLHFISTRPLPRTLCYHRNPTQHHAAATTHSTPNQPRGHRQPNPGADHKCSQCK